MAGPEDERAAGTGAHGRLRASHADRERVVGVLKAAFAQGRLDKDEFDLRIGLALASRTHADLVALTTGMPAGQTDHRQPEPARELVNKKAVAAVAGTTVAFMGAWRARVMTPDGSPLALPVVVVTWILLMAVATSWLLLLHDLLDKSDGGQSA